MPPRRRKTTRRTANRRKKLTLPKLPKVELEIPKPISQEVAGVLFALFAVLFFLTLSQNLGIVGQSIGNAFLQFFGILAWLLPILFGGLALAAFFGKKTNFNFTTFVGSFFLLFGAAGVFHTWRIPASHMGESFITVPSEAAGYFGVAASMLFRMFLGDVGAILILFGFFVIGALLAFQISLKSVISFLWSSFLFFLPQANPDQKIKPKEKFTILKPDIIEKEVEKGMQKALKKEKAKERKEETFSVHRPEFATPKSPKAPIPERSIAKEIPKEDFSHWEPPTLELLNAAISKFMVKDSELKRMAQEIEQKLAHFGITVEMRTAHVGPTVTQFTLVPDEKVKLSKITNLKNELALALSAESVRIEAPIPGKNLVGIEIPNSTRTTVHLREILESNDFSAAQQDGTLLLPLGRDVSGEPVIANLAEMPHLLIAGATGSGKSVCTNTFLISLLFQNSPADLRLILIDPKRVEMMPYNGIPHLLTPVITEAEKALSALRWAVAEMMRRYTEMGEKGYRNIAEYNTKEKEKMSKIIVVIDELADLMMRQYKKDTEAMICRLAQMARAVGMHLIIATQRPSVDVITGLIKANIPTRMAFSVTSSIDSRTVLDSIGAEDLLGKGDMLYTNPKLSKPQRIQGIFLSGDETERVINRIKLSMGDFETVDLLAASESDEINTALSNLGLGGGGDEDELEQEAIEVIRSTGKASASLLQRRLSVGYARAARLLDILEEKGLIGPSRGAKPREIFL